MTVRSTIGKSSKLGRNGVWPASSTVGESQDRVVKTVTAIETAAEHRLLINFHDSPVHPTGLQRTYPNLITVEYAHAQHDDVRAFSPVDFLRTIFVNMLATARHEQWVLRLAFRTANSRPGCSTPIYSTVATEVARTLITNTGLTVLPDAAEAYLEKAACSSSYDRCRMHGGTRPVC